MPAGRNRTHSANTMTRKLRTLLGVLILAISLWLLLWGFAPARRETRIQNLSPAEMQLPTPASFHFDSDNGARAVLTEPGFA
jgi:hypothetical protein